MEEAAIFFPKEFVNVIWNSLEVQTEDAEQVPPFLAGKATTTLMSSELETHLSEFATLQMKELQDELNGVESMNLDRFRLITTRLKLHFMQWLTTDLGSPPVQNIQLFLDRLFKHCIEICLWGMRYFRLENDPYIYGITVAAIIETFIPLKRANYLNDNVWHSIPTWTPEET